MRNRLIFLILFIISLNITSTVLAGDCHLLKPQKITPEKLDFTLDKTRLSTPVLQQEWEAFVL